MSDGWYLLIVAIPLIVVELAAAVEVALFRRDLPLARRGAWIAALVIVPYVSLLAYAVARPYRRRSFEVDTSAETAEPRATELVGALEMHVRGESSDRDYERAVAEYRPA